MPRRVRFGVSVVVVALVFALPVAAEAATANLTLNPAKGSPTSSFTATYTYKAPVGAQCPKGNAGTVTFYWDATSHVLGTKQLTGACTATLTASPPAGDAAPGTHGVFGKATDGTTSNTATYTITGSSPSPKPSPTSSVPSSSSPKASPSAKATGNPSPSPSPSHSATPRAASASATAAASSACPSTFVRATSGYGFLLAGAIQGESKDPQHLGWITIDAMSPATMLPPKLGHDPYVDVQVVKSADKATPKLLGALTNGTHFPCIYASLGPAKGWLFTDYVFRDAFISSIGQSSPSGDDVLPRQTMTIEYASVSWEYQRADDQGNPVGSVITGGGTRGSQGSGGGHGGALTGIGIAVLILLAGGAVVMTVRRSGRGRVSLNPQPLPPDEQRPTGETHGLNPQPLPPTEGDQPTWPPN